MSFQQGLSGLNGAQRALDAVSNNVANAGTVGFKLSQAQFADVYAASLAAGAGASQIGIGTQVGQVAQQFTQGNLTTTNNPLDVAINGGGFFRMSDGGTISYTRNGQFQLDKSGYITNAQGLRVTGYLADAIGTIVPGSPGDIQIQNTDISPRTTSQSQVQINLDSRSTTPSAMTPGSLQGIGVPGSTTVTAGTNDQFTLTVDGASVTVTIPPGTYTPTQLVTAAQGAVNTALAGTGRAASLNLDAANQITISSATTGRNSVVSLAAVAGNTGNATLGMGAPTATAGTDNFRTTDPLSYTSSTAQTVYDTLGNPHVLTMYYAKTATANTWDLYTTLDGVFPGGSTAAATRQTLSFDSNGALVTPMPLPMSYPVTSGATSPLSFNLDLAGSTQFGSTFGVNQMIQDGFASGRLSGISIAADGVVQGRYSNGQARNLGQLVLVNFNNPNGLLSMGGNQWAETSESGAPLVGAPGTASLGVVQSAAVEESNVDLTQELVNMITQQRNYQANAQSIRTQDQILQTLVNLR